jgi:hypothetical protein
MSHAGSRFTEKYHQKHATQFKKINSSKTYVTGKIYGAIFILWNKLLIKLT